MPNDSDDQNCSANVFLRSSTNRLASNTSGPHMTSGGRGCASTPDARLAAALPSGGRLRQGAPCALGVGAAAGWQEHATHAPGKAVQRRVPRPVGTVTRVNRLTNARSLAIELVGNGSGPICGARLGGATRRARCQKVLERSSAPVRALQLCAPSDARAGSPRATAPAPPPPHTKCPPTCELPCLKAPVWPQQVHVPDLERVVGHGPCQQRDPQRADPGVPQQHGAERAPARPWWGTPSARSPPRARARVWGREGGGSGLTAWRPPTRTPATEST